MSCWQVFDASPDKSFKFYKNYRKKKFRLFTILVFPGICSPVTPVLHYIHVFLNTVFSRLELLNNKMNPIKFSCLRKLRQLPALSCSVCCFHGTGDATSTLMAQTAKNMTTRMVYFHKSLLSQKFSN